MRGQSPSQSDERASAETMFLQCSLPDVPCDMNVATDGVREASWSRVSNSPMPGEHMHMRMVIKPS
jgi:hypothetical protein